MNILIIPSFIFTKQDRTLGSFIFEQAIALKNAGNNVFILYCDTYSIKDIHKWIHYEESVHEEINGISIYREKKLCPLKHKSGFYGCRESFTKSITKLYQEFLSDKKIDIIHAHCCAWAGYAAMKLSAATGIPYIITEHSTMYELNAELIKGEYEKAISDAFAGAKEVICVSQALKKLISPYRNDSVVVGNIVDCDLFRYHQQTGHSSDLVFLTVCYMKHEGQLKKKGIDLLINAFARIDDPNIRLNLGGGGQGEAIAREWVWQKKLENKVRFLGPLSRKEVSSRMKECDCFILPSRYETFGVVYAEAMACGKPVIATKTGGPDSFVDESNGLLIEADNEDAIVAAIEYMIHHVKEYKSEVIRHGIEDKFSMPAIAKQLINIYER